ncbi:hypothetical protein FOL46_002556, partial [Perkinsus olseni]
SASSARSEFGKAVGLDAKLIHLLRPEEVEALVAKVCGEDLDKRLRLRFLYQSALTEVPAVAPVQVNVPHVTSRLDYARYHRPLPTPGVGGRSDNGCGSSIHDLCLEQSSGADDSVSIKSVGMVSTLPIPGGGQCFNGRSDSRSVSYFLREWLQMCRLYGLSTANCWRYLLRCISAGVRSELMDSLEDKGFLVSASVEQRLQHAEMFLKGAYSITDDTVRYRQRLAQVKQKSNELIGEYIGRLRECLAEGRCLGINISNDELLDKFVRGLRQNYQKAVKTIYAHIRDTNELCSVLTLWEASNGENATVNSLSVDDDSVNAEAPQVLQAAQAQGSSQRGKAPMRCWHCNMVGHMKRDCELWKAKVRFQTAQTALVNTGKPVSSPPVSAPQPQGQIVTTPSSTSGVGGSAVGQGADRLPPNTASQDFEKVSVISAMEPRRSPWGAKVAALLDTGGQGTAYINAD